MAHLRHEQCPFCGGKDRTPWLHAWTSKFFGISFPKCRRYCRKCGVVEYAEHRDHYKIKKREALL